MKRDIVTDLMFALFVVALYIFFWALLCEGAPAPLPKRESTTSRCIPHICIMHWGECKYNTTFSPCGKYRAVSKTHTHSRWIGTWYVKRDLTGDTLVIQECCGDVVTDNVYTYNIKMCRCLKVSENRWVRLEPTK